MVFERVCFDLTIITRREAKRKRARMSGPHPEL